MKTVKAANEYWLVREISTNTHEAGYGKHAVPKLYTKGSASSIRNKRNREAEESGSVKRWETVPVILLYGEPEQS